MGSLLILLGTAVPASVALAACSTPGHVAGDGTANDPPTELALLAAKARHGEKWAQFSLGLRYELGQGVERDLPRAVKLYRRAAADRGGDRWIYLPPTSSGVRSQLMHVPRPLQPGLPEAKARLRELEAVQPR